MGRTFRKYTEPMLREAVENSTSVAGVLRFLGLAQAGGTHAHISRTITAFGIDTSHFVRHSNGAEGRQRTPDELLVVLPFGSTRAHAHRLRRALTEIGRLEACALCGNDGRWRDLPLRLEVDHISGDFHDNRPDNLRFLCPNCHSQTANFAGKGRGRPSTDQ